MSDVLKVTYRTNNSGGSWWLSDDDWRALEQAGWLVDWKKSTDRFVRDGRYMGALAVSASRSGLSMGAAIEEWERVTGQDSADLGCFSCCGPPHEFVAESADGATEYWSPEAPTSGAKYGADS